VRGETKTAVEIQIMKTERNHIEAKTRKLFRHLPALPLPWTALKLAFMLVSIAMFMSPASAYPPLMQIPTQYTILHSFADQPDGSQPMGTMSFVQGGSTLFGSTSSGGATNVFFVPYYGTLFTIGLDGSRYSIIHNFTYVTTNGYLSGDGINPCDGPTVNGDQLIGTTLALGSFDNNSMQASGVLYSCSTTGDGYSIAHDFEGSEYGDGANPYARPIVIDGVLYGTASAGGLANSDAGTVYQMSASGYSTLYSFDVNNPTNGLDPIGGLTATTSIYVGLNQLTNVLLYGTTASGGTNGNGVVFELMTRIGANGSVYSILHDFSEDPISEPSATLLLQSNILYGTASGGDCGVFQIKTDGTGFAILHQFAGELKLGPLVEYNGTLFGTAYNPSQPGGFVYSLNTTNLQMTEVYTFSANHDGTWPTGLVLVTNSTLGLVSCCPEPPPGQLCACLLLVRSTNVVLYGTTIQGGDYGLGTIYALPLNFNSGSNSGTNSVYTVPITEPENNSYFISTECQPANVLFTINTSGLTGIGAVDYYSGSTHLATVTHSPYSFTWANATPGTNSISILVSDTSGNIIGAAVEQIIVVMANQPLEANISAGLNFAVYLKHDGSAWSWGASTDGELGNPSVNTATTNAVEVVGVPGFVQVAAGAESCLALATNGAVWAWGYNGAYQVGYAVSGSGPYLPGSVTNPIPVYIGGSSPYLTGVKQVAASYDGQTSYALTTNGTVLAWGSGSDGALGNGQTSGVNPIPEPVVGLGGVISIAAGSDHALALTTNGTVYAWGWNWYGQIGNGSSGEEDGYYDYYVATPVRVFNLTNVISIAASAGSSYAIDSNGNVWAWGSNAAGQLGNGGTQDSSLPEPVEGLGMANEIVAITPAINYCLALACDGSFWAWGSNAYGQLGNGTVNASLVPEHISFPDGTTAVATSVSASYQSVSGGTKVVES
jgi:uncharacterized repeat protein (TIGR03803 family)